MNRNKWIVVFWTIAVILTGHLMIYHTLFPFPSASSLLLSKEGETETLVVEKVPLQVKEKPQLHSMQALNDKEVEEEIPSHLKKDRPSAFDTEKAVIMLPDGQEIDLLPIGNSDSKRVYAVQGCKKKACCLQDAKPVLTHTP